jgi:nitroreductase
MTTGGMETIFTLMRHKTAYSYRPEKISEADILLILESCVRAHSYGGLMLYSIIDIDIDDHKDLIISLSGMDRDILNATKAYLLVIDLNRSIDFLLSQNLEIVEDKLEIFLHAVVSCAMAAENLVVATEAMGYGVTIIDKIYEYAEKIIKEFRLPKYTFPLLLILIGVPKSYLKQQPPLPIDIIVHKNVYREYKEDEYSVLKKSLEVIDKDGVWRSILTSIFIRDSDIVIPTYRLINILRKQGFL